MTDRDELLHKQGLWPGLPGLLTLIFALVWAHALAGVLRAMVDLPFQALAPHSLSLTAAALLVGLTALRPRPADAAFDLMPLAVATSIFATSLIMVAPVALPFLALAPTALASSWLHKWLGERVPNGLAQPLRKSVALRAVWVLLAVLAVVQMARLSTYMSNPDSDWFVTTSNAFFAKHECANAYIFAAELNDRNEPDIYDPAHYPGLNPQASPHTDMVGMGVEDPFQYPPNFLLLPKLAMSMTRDYATIRSVWFALNVTFCLGSVFLLSLWVGRRSNLGSLWLTPLLASAFPVLHNFQYGQFHFAAVALGAMGMLALDVGRRWTGAGLLAAAISAKVFPVFLLLPLLGQKRFADVLRVATLGAALTAVGWFVLGSTPYVAFIADHMPRLANGKAFAFGEAWPEVADLIVAGNQGVAGIVFKLKAMGLPFLDSSFASGANRLYALSLIPLLWLAGKASLHAGRPARSLLWLGTLGAASLASTGAWADYVPLTAVWALVLLLPQLRQRPVLRTALIASGVFQVTLLGSLPLGAAADPSWMLPLSLLGSLGMLFVFGVATWAPRWLPQPRHSASSRPTFRSLERLIQTTE